MFLMLFVGSLIEAAGNSVPYSHLCAGASGIEEISGYGTK